MSSRRRFATAFAAVAAFALAPAAAPVAAYWAVDVFHGSHCNPSHYNGETEMWAYEGAKLVNNGTSNWDVLVASCPVNVTPPTQATNARIHEIRVYVDGATLSNGWCRLTDWQRVLRTMHTTSWAGPEVFFWQPPVYSTPVSRDFTVECLVLKDWALASIEVVWYWP